MTPTNLTPEALSELTLLRECFSYDAMTGSLVWKARPSHHFNSNAHHIRFNSTWAGKAAGSVDPSGYRRVSAKGQRWLVHRLVWFLHYGEEAHIALDHINADRLDNRIANLRLAVGATNYENQRTPRARNKSGYLGVTYVPNRNSKNKFIAQIMVGRVHIHLGSFADPATAHQAYLNAKRELHQGCTI